MIERPRRSVTRFFIPLIDVLILLFCIFLLMPFMSQPGNVESADAQKALDKTKDLTPDQMRRMIVDLQFDLDRARKVIGKLERERADPTERLSVGVLEIDPKSGGLFVYRDGERLAIADERSAESFIDEHRRRSGPGKEPFFIVLMPRELTGYPSRRQLDEYTNWFTERNVKFRFDDPLAPKPQ